VSEAFGGCKTNEDRDADEACITGGFGGRGVGHGDGRDMLQESLEDVVGEVCRYEVLGDRRCPCGLSVGE